MKFRIYYDDGSTYSSDPFFAPATGVINIAIEDKGASRGFCLVQSKDAYYYKESRWWGCDDMGMYDYLMSYKGPKAVLFGRTIRNDLYWKVVQQAIKEGINGPK